VAVGVMVVIVVMAGMWIVAARSKPGEVHGTFSAGIADGATCMLPIDGWARLVFAARNGTEIDASWFDHGTIVSENPCRMEHEYSVKLAPGQTYQVSLQFADPVPGVNLPLQPVAQITPEDYSDGRVDFDFSAGTVT
jgi:hypothetical protein